MLAGPPALDAPGEHHSLRIAIVGRPNVGKSSLFNRLVRRQLALVHRIPGVTRDVREATGSLAGLAFQIMDTAGLDEARSVVLRGIATEQGTTSANSAAVIAMERVLHDKGVLAGMIAKTEAAVRRANVILFMVDGKAGLSPWDEHFARWLRARAGAGQRVVLVVNKCDGRIPPAWGAADAAALGFGEPVYLSAEHGDGLADLYLALRGGAAVQQAEPAATQAGGGAGASGARVVETLGTPEEERIKRHERSGVRLCIIGRPNAGKSSLANALVGAERFLVGDMPGVTQDAVYVHQRWPLPPDADAALHSLGLERAADGCVPVTIVDTAGMLRRSAAASEAIANVPRQLAALAFEDALRAIRQAHVAVLVVDATLGFHRTDAMIADTVAREGRGLVVALSKWDRVPQADRASRAAELREALASHVPPALRDAPVRFVSTDARLADPRTLWPAVFGVYVAWNRRVPTGLLNQWLRTLLAADAPAAPSKVTYVSQVAARPPSIAVFANAKTGVVARNWDSWLRWLAAKMRQAWDMHGVPIRLRVRSEAAAKKQT